jgi:hypothetical protein
VKTIGNRKWVIDLCILVAVLLAVSISHIDSLFTPSKRDDLSVLRASSYLTFYPADPLIERLENDLITNAGNLGAIEIARIAPILSALHPQVQLDRTDVLVWLGAQGRGDEAEMRIAATYFVNGAGQYFEAFEELLKTVDVKSIVMRPTIYAKSDVQALLAQLGYVNVKDFGKYMMVWR